MKRRWFSRAVLASLVLFGASGQAAAITWDFHTGYGDEGTIGNVRTFTVDGITVTATAWSYDGTSFQQARLGQWSTGLAVCNQAEACGDPIHQVDNYGQNEYVLFQFSSAVDPLSVRIDPYGSYDRDVSYWTGTTTLPSDLLLGETYASLGGLGFSSQIDDWGTVSTDPRDVSISSPFVTTLLFGARYTGGAAGSEDGYDYFKISSITTVPEPSSLLLMGLGMLGLGWLARKQQFSA